MIRHQAIRVGFGNGGDVQPILLQEEIEIFFLPEYILEPIGMVEYMVAGIRYDRLHGINLVLISFWIS
jgi:hypothetical protein